MEKSVTIQFEVLEDMADLLGAGISSPSAAAFACGQLGKRT